MAKSYVLDTSAILTLAKAEGGSDTVEDILISARKGKSHVYLSFISFMELYYIATAIDRSAVLVHKDPELGIISNYIETLELPYKRGKK